MFGHFCRSIRPGAMNATVQTIMSRHVVMIEPDAKLGEALALLAKHRFHHLVVCRERIAIGILSDRDLLRAQSPFLNTLAERTLDAHTLERPVHQLMTRKLVTASQTSSIADASTLMLDHGVSSLVVTEPQAPVDGIVTWRDLLRWYAQTPSRPGGP